MHALDADDSPLPGEEEGSPSRPALPGQYGHALTRTAIPERGEYTRPYTRSSRGGASIRSATPAYVSMTSPLLKR